MTHKQNRWLISIFQGHHGNYKALVGGFWAISECRIVCGLSVSDIILIGCSGKRICAWKQWRKKGGKPLQPVTVVVVISPNLAWFLLTFLPCLFARTNCNFKSSIFLMRSSLARMVSKNAAKSNSGLYVRTGAFHFTQAEIYKLVGCQL